jgi:hypothetical protein
VTLRDHNRGFAMTLMPCFGPHQAEAEGHIVGRILAGYGELEVLMLACLVSIEGQTDLPTGLLFKRMSAEKRIKEAKKTLLPDFKKAGLENEMSEALSDVNWCRKLRNQYAHCQWGWTKPLGLFFVNLEDLAEDPAPIVKVMNKPLYVDVPLLSEQEAYCNYVREQFMHLQTAYEAWDRKSSTPKLARFIFPKPPKIAGPNFSN